MDDDNDSSSSSGSAMQNEKMDITLDTLEEAEGDWDSDEDERPFSKIDRFRYKMKVKIFMLRRRGIDYLPILLMGVGIMVIVVLGLAIAFFTTGSEINSNKSNTDKSQITNPSISSSPLDNDIILSTSTSLQQTMTRYQLLPVGLATNRDQPLGEIVALNPLEGLVFLEVHEDFDFDLKEDGKSNSLRVELFGMMGLSGWGSCEGGKLIPNVSFGLVSEEDLPPQDHYNNKFATNLYPTTANGKVAHVTFKIEDGIDLDAMLSITDGSVVNFCLRVSFASVSRDGSRLDTRFWMDQGDMVNVAITNDLENGSSGSSSSINNSENIFYDKDDNGNIFIGNDFDLVPAPAPTTGPLVGINSRNFIIVNPPTPSRLKVSATESPTENMEV